MKNKNIFILPTTEPSQVYLVKDTNALGITSNNPESMEHYGSGTHNQHIYITNKDPYRKGDWVKSISIDLEIPFKLDADGLIYTVLAPCNFEKIVITSDPKLILDGIAGIDIEFLRLLKDKKLQDISTVEVEQTPLLSNNGRALYGYKYTPIIPSKEEPMSYEDFRKKASNDLIIKFDTDCSKYSEDGDSDNYFYSNCKYWESKLKEEPNYNMKQEILAEMEKQETLEEAIERLYGAGYETLTKEQRMMRFCRLEGFMDGSDWQKEHKRNVVITHKQESKDDYQQELFNYLHSELGVIPLQSEMQEIERIVDSMPSKNIYSEEDMREMYNKSCGLIGLGELNDQTENNNRFRELIEKIKNK